MKKNIFFLFFLFPLFIYPDSFFFMMGKDGDNWKYVQTMEDMENIKCYENIYSNFVNSHPEGRIIPPVIHLVHLGSNSLNKKNLARASVWQKKHPDWKIVFWTDRKHKSIFKNIEQKLIDDLPDIFKEEYFSTSNYKEREMLLAFEILNDRGGVFASLDLLDLSKFSQELLSFDFFTALSLPHDTMASSCIYISGDIIGASRSNPIIKRAIEICKSKWKDISNSFIEDDLSSHAYRYMHRILFSLQESFKEKNNNGRAKDIALPYFKIFSDKKIHGSVAFEMKNWVKLDPTIEDKIIRNLEETEKKFQIFYFGFIAIIFLMVLIFFILVKKKKVPFSSN